MKEGSKSGILVCGFVWGNVGVSINSADFSNSPRLSDSWSVVVGLGINQSAIVKGQEAVRLLL